jgi:hypothetical protein
VRKSGDAHLPSIQRSILPGFESIILHTDIFRKVSLQHTETPTLKSLSEKTQYIRLGVFTGQRFKDLGPTRSEYPYTGACRRWPQVPVQVWSPASLAAVTEESLAQMHQMSNLRPKTWIHQHEES